MSNATINTELSVLTNFTNTNKTKTTMKLVKVNVMYVDVDAIVSNIKKNCEILSAITTNADTDNINADIVGTLCAIDDNIGEITNKIIKNI